MLKITESGGQRVRFKIASQAAKAQNLTPVHREFGDYRARRHFSIFNRGESPYDEKWAALKPATIAEKRRKGYDLRILHRKPKLRHTFFIHPTARKIEWGYTAPYAKYHVKGTKHLPIRSPLEDGRGLMNRDFNRYKQILAEYLLAD